MLESVRIVRYRGLRNLEFEQLARVNLFTGPNGVGKSSVAEALWLFHGRYNPGILGNVHLQRTHRFRRSDVLGHLVAGNGFIEIQGHEDGTSVGVKFQFTPSITLSPEATVTRGQSQTHTTESSDAGTITIDLAPPLIPTGEITATYREGEDERVVKYPVTQLGIGGPIPPPRPTGAIIVSSDPFTVPGSTIEKLSDAFRRGEKASVMKALRILQPRIKDLQVLVEGQVDGQPNVGLWADLGTKTLLPIQALGGGLVRTLTIVVNLLAATKGIVVIDEIENGIHHGSLASLWTQIDRLSRAFDVQVFATTHSRECVDAAASVFRSRPEELLLHRLYPSRTGPANETYSTDSIEAAGEIGFEVR